METIQLILLLIFLGVLLGTLAFLIGVKITGSKGRDYSTLRPTDEVNGQNVLEIIKKYKPIIYQKEDIKNEIKFIFYEFVEQKNTLVLIYRPVWEDEIHPNPIINQFYKIFRWFYYGSIKDIEFIEIFIDKKMGELLSFSFETLAEGSSIEAPKHELTTLVKQNKAFFNKNKNKPVFVPFDGSRCILQVITWNHLFAIPKNLEGEGFDCPLKPLTEQHFRKYAISRRSSGLVKTRANKKIAYIVSISLSIIFGLIIPLFLYFLIR
ncbi:MAG: hypothetical protein GF308_21800 [Candidatus Heimdallarchaeota archaeon]|nr:hypothetical protein [Candidatus Heimdallarchaeota archaeon]